MSPWPRGIVAFAVATATALAAAFLTVTPAVAASRAPHSSGCARPGAAGVTTTTIDDAGTQRSYRLAVPPGLGPFGLVLNFHGLGSNDVGQAIYSQLEQAGPAAGDVVVTPQGTGPQAFWNILPNLATPDDVAYAGLLIDQAERTECINPTRVYSTGISNGAGLSTLLGCRLANRLAAIAPVSGINLVPPCPHGTPLAVLAFHGNSDPVVPYNGGQLSPGLGSLPTTPVPIAVASWAARDGCARTPRAGVGRVDRRRDRLPRLSRRHPGAALHAARRRPHVAGRAGRPADVRQHEPPGRARPTSCCGSSAPTPARAPPASSQPASPIHTDFRLQNSRIPCADSSRPYPDCFTPPKGSSGNEVVIPFTNTAPASKPSMQRRCSSGSVVQAFEPSPKSVSLAERERGVEVGHAVEGGDWAEHLLAVHAHRRA